MRCQTIVRNIIEDKEISFLLLKSHCVSKKLELTLRHNPLPTPLFSTYKIIALETVVKGKL